MPPECAFEACEALVRIGMVVGESEPRRELEPLGLGGAKERLGAGDAREGDDPSARGERESPSGERLAAPGGTGEARAGIAVGVRGRAGVLPLRGRERRQERR